MWTAKVMLFSSNYQSILAQFSRRKMPDNGLYTEYIKRFKEDYFTIATLITLSNLFSKMR